jgi:glutamyl-tRNA reductase
MRIGILGINHKSADLRLREKLAKACHRRFGSENSLHSRFSYVLLSTCNRTEIYFSSPDLAQTHTHLLAILRGEVEEEFEHRVYSYFGSDCFFHLACVTAGVDSALVGETEIQGQVKRAYEDAVSIRPLSSELHFLFQKCLKIGKNVRTQEDLSRGLPTLEEAILQAGENLLGNLERRKILFVGLSEINHKIFVRFKQKGFRNITFCNRSFEKAARVAEREHVKLLPWEEFGKWISFDLAIFGTKCPDFLVSEAPMSYKQKLVIDLSVPRNVDPQLGRQKGITLLNVDQLNRVIDRRRRIKAAEIGRLETHVIARAVERQVSLFKLKELQRSQTVLSTTA